MHPGECSLCTLGKRWNPLFWGKMPCRYQLGLTSPLYKAWVSLLIFCLLILSTGVSGVLNSPTIIVLLLISPFVLVSICLMYWGAPMLGAYIFNSYICFLDWSLDHYIVAFFVSYHGLYFKVYFVWYEYCYSCFILVSICMKYFFSSPSLSACICP